MKELTEKQIEEIMLEISRQEVHSEALELEILDHVCCVVEGKMENGTSFKDALRDAIESFGERGLFKIEEEIKQQRKKKGILRKLKLSTTSIAACLVFLVLAVDAQERPEIKPLESGNFRISSTFGQRIDPINKQKSFHKGIDMAVAEGTPVKATANGVILEILDHESGYGKHIIVTHDDEYQTLYANLSEFKVSPGQKVKKGEVIALSGNTGRSTAPHLHYEVIRNGQPVDPELYFSE